MNTDTKTTDWRQVMLRNWKAHRERLLRWLTRRSHDAERRRAGLMVITRNVSNDR